jgi:LL-diaminopimelate aminotransferase
MIRLAKRLTELPPYLYARIDEAAERARASGLDIINMGIGDPDRDPPQWIRELLVEEVKREGNHRYPSYKGNPRLWDGALAYLARRFNVSNLGHEHICTTIGSKEGLAHLVAALLNRDDSFITQDPSYPVFATIAKLFGATEITVPMLPDNQFQPDLSEELSEHQLRASRVMYINYPHNPTGRVARDKYLQDVVRFARDNNIILVSDIAYAEIFYGVDNRPSSVLEFEGALDCAIEFHSFSKTFNMTGWRCGFAVGNPELIRGLTTVKTNIDSGVFNAIQLAIARALEDPRCDDFLNENRAFYQARLDRICAALDDMGITYYRPGASIFIWCALPGDGFDSIKWCSDLLQETGLIVGPGRAYGHYGEGFFRLSLTTADADIDEALERLAGFIKRQSITTS